MDFQTTSPEVANPFASTVYDPRELQKRVDAIMARAEKRRAKIPAPGSYWEEPGHHGTGRQVILRKARAIPLKLENKAREALRLPPLPRPRANLSGGTVALVAVGAIGTGVLIGYLWNRARKRELAGTPSLVSGFDLLGCAS